MLSDSYAAPLATHVFGWLMKTCQTAYYHRQQIEILRLKMLWAQLTLASSSFICSDTDNSIGFLWTAGGRFESTHCVHHFLFLRLGCRPPCTWLAKTWTDNNPHMQKHQVQVRTGQVKRIEKKTNKPKFSQYVTFSSFIVRKLLPGHFRSSDNTSKHAACSLW